MSSQDLTQAAREAMDGGVRVELGARSYEVSIGRLSPDAIAEKIAAALDPKTTGVAVLIDANVAAVSARARDLVAALAKRLPRVLRLDLRQGEACKNLTELEKTCEWLAANEYDRRSAVVGVGGGAATDHAGFAAAVYLRGVPFALVPTTLLAMVDASVGGKTGVDLGAGKNLVGAFHQPRAVVADVGFLETLPARERIAGLAEVAKCGFIADAGLLDLLEQSGPDLTVAQHQQVITRAVRVKADVVASDEHEGGRRAILNFGHTVGHALESASGYGLLHGEAVALGMVAALDLGVALGVGAPALAARARSLLAHLGLPIDYERRFDAQAQAGIAVDKKRRGSTIRFVLVPTPGETQFMDIAPADIASHLARRSGAKA
jgi:3-dehydroquinate synthase